MPEANVTFTATWKVDANGDGEPDDTETKYSITYSDGEAKGAAQGMPAKAENILSGTTQTISAAVPTWIGYVFTGWTSTDVTETTGSFTMPEKDVTFTALWKEYSSGGPKKMMMTMTRQKKMAAAAPENPSRLKRARLSMRRERLGSGSWKETSSQNKMGIFPRENI